MKRTVNWLGWGFGIAGWGYLLSLSFFWYPTLIFIILYAAFILLEGLSELVKHHESSNWMALFLFILCGITFGALIDIPHLFLLAAFGFITFFIIVYAMDKPSHSK